MAPLACILAQNVQDAELVVNSTALLTETDENFICATIDWWPHDKCNYNRCPWGYSSAINLVRLVQSYFILNWQLQIYFLLFRRNG